MSGINDTTIWITIAFLAVGTFLIRFSFIGLIGDRPLPPYLLRLLRFVPVAVMPGLVAPLVVWPAATDGAFDLPRLAAAAATLLVGGFTKNALAAIISGMAVLYLMLWLV